MIRRRKPQRLELLGDRCFVEPNVEALQKRVDLCLVDLALGVANLLPFCLHEPEKETRVTDWASNWATLTALRNNFAQHCLILEGLFDLGNLFFSSNRDKILQRFGPTVSLDDRGTNQINGAAALQNNLNKTSAGKI